MADNPQVVVEFVGDATKLNAAVAETDANFKKLSNNRFEEINKNLGLLEQGAKKSGVGAKELSDRFKELGVSIPDEAMKQYSGELQDVVTKHITLRAQLTAAKQAFADLTEQGKKGTAEWNAARQSLQKVAMQVDDLNKTVQRLASGTKVFAGLIDAARGVAAGFAIAKGATALFGSENKKLEEAIKQLVGVMAILQGLQEVQLLLKEESAAMQLILNGRDLAAVGIKKLQTAAESSNIIVSKAATAAQWLLNAAMNANPIMLLVGALTIAVGALLYFTRATEDATEATKELVAEFDEQIEALKELDEVYINSGKRKIDLLKAQQADLKTIRDAEIENTELEIKSIQRQLKERQTLSASLRYDLYKLEGEEQKKREDEINANEKKIATLEKQEQDLKNQLLIIGVKYNQDVKNENDKAYKEALAKRREFQKAEEDAILQSLKDYDEAAKKLREALIAEGDKTELSKEQRIQYYFLAGMTKEEIAKRLADVLSEAEQQAADVLNSRIKKEPAGEKEPGGITSASDDDGETFGRDYFAKIWKESMDKKAADQLATEQQIAAASIQIAKQTSDSLFSIQMDRIHSEYDEAMKFLEKRREDELENINLTEGQKAAINEKYARQEAALKLRQWKAEQTAKQEQAIINGALAITALIASAPPVIGVVPNAAFFIGLATVIATTALQVGMIAGAKPPSFAKGTEFVGLGSNPKGTDTIPAYLNEGERVVPTHINEKLRGISNEDLPKLMAAYYIPMPHAPELSGMNLVVNAPAIDYKKLGKVIAEELRANPSTHINIDKGGFAIHTIEKGRKIERLNNRYES